MPWARFEDDYLGNRKLTTLSTLAIALDMAGIVYSARELRDGRLTVADVQIIAALIHIRRWSPAAEELVRVNRWQVLESGGWMIHDYLDYQPSREKVLTERTSAAERKRRQRRDENGHFKGMSQRDSGVSPAGVTAGVTTAPYPVPVPVPGVTKVTPNVLTPNPFPTEGVETGAEPPSPSPGPGRRANGTNPRATGANPRTRGTNPRATGSNPRRRRGLEFNEDGPQYVQRVGADGKREWVPVDA
jgi:hypothetical protein